jgi:hypothetical protein
MISQIVQLGIISFALLPFYVVRFVLDLIWASFIFAVNDLWS